MLRIVYMGTPEFACPALEALVRHPSAEVTLVVSQPDRRSGRGRTMHSPPVKRLAEELGLEVYQTDSLKSAEQRAPIVEAAPDLIVVAAFGLILRRSILELPRFGCVNLHASLLPDYRGAAPVSAAILSGDTQTGVTFMQMERGLDTGPMLATRVLDISGDDTTESLTPRLGELAGQLIAESLDLLSSGQMVATPQTGGGSLTRPLTKADGAIDWSKRAIELERHVRAMWSWPRAWTSLPNGDALQVHLASAVDPGDVASSGTVRVDHRRVLIATGEGWLSVERAQLPGGKPIEGNALVQAMRKFDEAVLGAGVDLSARPPLVTSID